jgi:hypothetical protein
MTALNSKPANEANKKFEHLPSTIQNPKYLPVVKRKFT